jgi:hypothetical protein
MAEERVHAASPAFLEPDVAAYSALMEADA